MDGNDEPSHRAPDAAPAEAVPPPVGGVDEVQVIGALADSVAALLGLATAARSVWLHPSTTHHICTRRGMDRGDADFVFANLPAAVMRPHDCGPDPRSNGRYDLVYIPAGAARAVFVAIKVVDAASAQSAQDEAWVSTAHPVPRDFMARKRYRDSLRRTGFA